MPTAAERLRRAEASLQGLATGDAFGEQFFDDPERIKRALLERRLPPPVWSYTDDTAMALSIVEVLRERETVEQDRLAELFAARYWREPTRGYGRGAHEVLAAIGGGRSWREAASATFGGAGSMGNGGAMRSAPIGAYFCDDLGRAAQEARWSAEVTHAHPEGGAGAIAVAIAAACIARGVRTAAEFFDTVLSWTPPSETRRGIEQALALGADCPIDHAVTVLGSGRQVLSQDTVPFCLWSVACDFTDFEGAMWRTVAGLGDRDTTCAIVGGILAASPQVSIPGCWLAARERLPENH
jgi:ADP-ribosylglycohydrolase